MLLKTSHDKFPSVLIIDVNFAAIGFATLHESKKISSKWGNREYWKPHKLLQDWINFKLGCHLMVLGDCRLWTWSAKKDPKNGKKKKKKMLAKREKEVF